MARTSTKTASSNPLASLAAAATAAPKAKSKNDIPVVSTASAVGVNNDQHRKEINIAITNWLNAERTIKDAEAQQVIAEATLAPVGEDNLLKLSRQSGNVQKSLRLSDGSVSLRMTQATKWLGMKAEECQSQLEAELGEDFDHYIRRATKISLNTEALENDPKMAEQLLKLLGDRAGEFLTSETILRPTDTFLNDCMMDAKMHQRWVQLRNAGLCKLQKLSFAK